VIVNRPYAPWDPVDDDAFVCQAVRTVAPDMKTVVLAPSRASTVRFEAGQYVTVEFDIDGRAVNRCYTIASPPTRPERIAITVKCTRDGAVSRWLHDGGIGPGSVVRIGVPQGEFTIAAHPAESYLLLTAGSGITPALSMLRTLYDLGAECDLVLVHSQRRAAEVPYRDELDWMARHVPGLRIHYLCGDEADETLLPSVVAGRLGPEVLAALVPDAATREVLACGPTAYRETARAATSALGCAPNCFHEESYTFDDLRAEAPITLSEFGRQGNVTLSSSAGQGDVTLSASDGQRDLSFSDGQPDLSFSGGQGEPALDSFRTFRTFRIEFRDHGVTIGCAADTTILDAAAAAGLTLPSSCAQGLCGTCKSTLVAGEVDMRHNGGIRPREIAAGKVLLCCSRPKSDLVVTG
jgi:ferredoxin-NADP reductase/ferredoxin